ncbi:BofC C-terminal domain-containing protein [Gottfriedia sp. NPDC058432]|uniref:BofC C-terminal domain-containing protein n=1 Tax=Bacillaceae TaxID=186817 RepID=UPI0006FAE79E|nr:BofC C-terminal domain-containing protein [Bacillus sp. FJAT-25509]
MKKFILIFVCLLALLIPAQTETLAAHNELQHSSNKKGITIILHKVYINGEVIEEIYINQHKTLGQVKKEFKGWKVIEENDDQIVLMKKINDLSPTLKAKGYFGINSNGVLNLYIGVPSGNNIIESFFQIDTNKLEVNKQKQLEQGIKISTKDHYDYLLHYLKEYERIVN